MHPRNHTAIAQSPQTTTPAALPLTAPSRISTSRPFRPILDRTGYRQQGIGNRETRYGYEVVVVPLWHEMHSPAGMKLHEQTRGSACRRGPSALHANDPCIRLKNCREPRIAKGCHWRPKLESTWC
ncbi:hypothetical protein BGZ61DRAFT_438206 [Ilyonectria robusta]|uniref:uncharacterized protein n=1 Tax=Ilyonectria robusta TaxID=1079257 RepID=UPI001E8D97FA|nr:uncharacterized protein BGZ61DRAFT_438206 [Ilyonectria robusta]KAH8737373.1 hypothetical protein BGZ61DRAFT_438206 [Ilyonectria robusta]